MSDEWAVETSDTYDTSRCVARPTAFTKADTTDDSSVVDDDKDYVPCVECGAKLRSAVSELDDPGKRVCTVCKGS
jgi:hypothetical protein